ncbi:MAG: hypothetical protein ABI462_08925 [Ignavibacteria bacterium]
MPRIFITVFFLLICAGCEKQEEVQKPPVTRDTSTTKKESVETEILSDIFEGLYIVNINSSTFQDCAHPDSTYWVVDDSKKFAAAYNRIYDNPSVYGSIAAKVKGEVEDTKDEKIKIKYPRTLRVKEVINTEKKNSSNTCVPYDYWAFGKDPAWSLEISAKENIIALELPSEKKTYYFFYAEQKQREGFIVYSNYNTIQRNSIEVKIKKEDCTDASGKSYPYFVEVELTGNKKFKGCAIKGKNPDIM